jgi:hypothetical protein
MSITLVPVGDVFISVLEYIHPTELKALMPPYIGYCSRILYFVSVNIKRQAGPHDFLLCKLACILERRYDFN